MLWPKWDFSLPDPASLLWPIQFGRCFSTIVFLSSTPRGRSPESKDLQFECCGELLTIPCAHEECGRGLGIPPACRFPCRIVPSAGEGNLRGICRRDDNSRCT